jgi:hypothetical protein
MDKDNLECGITFRHEPHQYPELSYREVEIVLLLTAAEGEKNG